jgi:hypothetical protein
VTADQIVKDVLTHAAKAGPYTRWYAGIASNPRTRLFSDHKVHEENDWWIIREATNESTARVAENSLHANGFDGAGGGGSKSTIYVYAYRKSAHTVE